MTRYSWLTKVTQPMSKDDLLSASQAQLVYILMMVIENGMRKFEWVQEMLMLSGVRISI